MHRVGRTAHYLYHHHFIRYLLVGGTTFILDETLLVVLHGVLAIPLPIAVTISYMVAFIYNFSLNRWWAFSASENQSLSRHIVPYSFLFVFNLVFTVVFVGAASHVISYAVAKPIAVIIQTFWNYFIYKNVIFVKASPQNNA